MRIVPHVVDAVLLATATALAVLSYQYPFVQGWLTAKVLALVLYIVCGTMAIKRGKTKAVRGALLCRIAGDFCPHRLCCSDA